MSSLIDRVVTSYSQASALYSLPDYPLVSFEALLLINAAYLFILWALLRIMAKVDEPFELYAFRVVYNSLCVLLSGYTAYLFISDAYSKRYGFVCNNSFPHPTANPDSRYAAYVFLLSKYFELTDTFVMALRKSTRQITLLHVYHHVSISFVVWCYSRFSSGGDEWVPASLNSLVHVFMYSHYTCMTLGLRAPWKPLLTLMQLTQFCLIFAQSVLGLVRECGWADFLNALQLVYMLSMLVLFGDFFLKAYLSPPGRRSKDE